MAKAHLITKEGTKITIEGTPQEVAMLVKQLGGIHATSGRTNQLKGLRKKRIQVKATPTNLVAGLIDGGFFKKPRELTAIKFALEEQGHKLQVTKLSPVLIRLVRGQQLKRTKDKKRWIYTNYIN